MAKLPVVQVPVVAVEMVTIPRGPIYFLEPPTGSPELDAQRNVIPRESVLWSFHHILAAIVAGVFNSDESEYRRLQPVIAEMKKKLAEIDSAFDYGLMAAQKDHKLFGTGMVEVKDDKGVVTLAKVDEPLVVFKIRTAKNTNGQKKVIEKVTFSI